VRCGLVLAILALACSAGCGGREPRPLEPGEEIGDRFPDDDMDYEAARADPGHELYIPPEGTPEPEYRTCTKEEVDRHIAENTMSDGRIREIGIFCLKDQPPPPAATTAPVVRPQR
jgi:hypothetical protein